MYKETAFRFDGIPCTDYGLMIYYFDDQQTRELALGTDVSIIEDRLSKRIDPISYGVEMNQPMEFSLTFGSRETMTEDQVEEILAWLTGHQRYKWLELYESSTICGDSNDDSGPTAPYVRYRCHINEVSTVYVNELPFAFEATVECDGQFGYMYPPAHFDYEMTGSETEVILDNQSMYNGYLYPILEFSIQDSCNVISITNETDHDREFKIDTTDADFNLSGLTITVDCQNGIIQAFNESQNYNLYPYFNKKFFRLVRGNNTLKLKTDTGTCNASVICVWRKKVSC